MERAGRADRQLQKQGKNDETLPLAQKALHIAEATFGPEHPNTAPALDRLGGTDIALRSHSEAEPLVNRAFAIREGFFACETAPVAESLNRLGELCYFQGKFTEPSDEALRILLAASFQSKHMFAGERNFYFSEVALALTFASNCCGSSE